MMKLRPYQEEDVDFLSKLNACACFNEQRTGKTPTALNWLLRRNLDKEKTIIVTTASTVYQWKQEYETWLGKPCVVLDGTKKNKEKKLEEWTHGLVICIHSLKTTKVSEGMIKDILGKKPKAVILDEAHQIRNPQTACAKAMFKLSKIENKIALTGTPAYSSPADIWSILHFLFPNTYTSQWRWKSEFMEEDHEFFFRGGQRVKISKFVRLKKEKEQVLAKELQTFSTIRKRKDIMQWIPKKDRTIIKLELDKDQQKALKELKNTFRTENISTATELDRMIRYRQICLDPSILLESKKPSPKTQWILDFIEDNQQTPIIIFSNFTTYLQLLLASFKEHGVKCAMIVGEVNTKTRQKFVNDFQEGKFNVFLINTLAGKEGLTLDRAEAEIFTDVFPPIGALEQAEDRFVPTSPEKATKPKAIYHLQMAGSFDEHIYNLLSQRKEDVNPINEFRRYVNE